MSIQLQPRDLAILKDVFKYRVKSYAQICARHFPGRHKTVGYERLRELTRAGYLSGFSHVVANRSQKYVETTDLAWKVIRNAFTYEMDHPHLKSESPLHDIRFADVASRFEKIKCFAGLWTENLLRSSSSLSEMAELSDLILAEADAALSVTASNGRRYLYALEYELNKKSPARYKEKLSSYYTNRHIQGLIYIGATQEILNSLARVNADVCGSKRSILFQALESDVLKSSGKLRFQGHQGAMIEFI